MKFVFVAVLLIVFVFALVLAAPPQHPNRAQHSNRLQHPHECVLEALKIKDSAGRREAMERCKTEMRRR